jgi:hypothetical protein
LNQPIPYTAHEVKFAHLLLQFFLVCL